MTCAGIPLIGSIFKGCEGFSINPEPCLRRKATRSLTNSAISSFRFALLKGGRLEVNDHWVTELV